MLMRLLRVVLLTVSLALPAASALADDDVDYLFTLNWQSGPLTGTSSSGSLSFNKSLAMPNAEYFGTASLSLFHLSVGSTFYDLSDVSVGFLTFDANAELRLLGIGTSCGPGFCTIAPGDPPGLMIVYDSQSQLDRFSGYYWPATADQSYGAGTFAIAAIPEPGTMTLLLAGGVLLAWRRRAAPKAAPCGMRQR